MEEYLHFTAMHPCSPLVYSDACPHPCAMAPRARLADAEHKVAERDASLRTLRRERNALMAVLRQHGLTGHSGGARHAAGGTAAEEA